MRASIWRRWCRQERAADRAANRRVVRAALGLRAAQVPFDTLIVGNFALKSLAFCATFTAIVRATLR